MKKEEIEYNDYRNLICSIANKWSGWTGLAVEELIAEGNYAFWKAVDQYNGEVAFSTYLFSKANSEMQWYAKKFHLPANVELDFEPVNMQNPEKMYTWTEKLETLSLKAQEVIRIIFDAPDDFIMQVICSSKKNKSINTTEIRTYLHANGWALRTINSVFKEIQLMLV